MIIIRLLALAALVVGLVAATRDAVLTTSNGSLVLTSLGKDWFTIDRGSLNLSQAFVQRYLVPEIWDPFIVTILQWPSWVVFGGLAVLLGLASQLRRS